MSSPDADTGAASPLEAAAAAVLAAPEQALADGTTERISDAAVQRLLTAGIRIYAHKVEHERREFAPVASASAITATEAVVVLSGMLRALNLSLFDLSMWMDGRAPR
jgi:hypothetical protein